MLYIYERKMFILVLAISIIHHVAGGLQFSSYQKTKVFLEKEDCQYSLSYHLIKQESRQSSMTCGAMCSDTDNCRRYMFDSATKDCSLFKYGENCITHEDIKDKVCFQQIFLHNESSSLRCQMGYYGDNCEQIIEDCHEGIEKNLLPPENILSFIKPAQSKSPFEVRCNLKYSRYTVVQFRETNCESVNFERSWNEYVEGFGNTHSSYWLGLEPLRAILKTYPTFRLVILVRYLDNVFGQVQYANFTVGDNLSNYQITLGTYSKFTSFELGDSLTPDLYSINGRPFSTYDRDYSNNNCPERFGGGWWYLHNNICCYANVNGRRNLSTPVESLKWENIMGTSRIVSDIQIKLLRG